MDYYSSMSAQETISCSEKEYEKLKSLAEEFGVTWEFDRYKNELCIFAENFDIEEEEWKIFFRYLAFLIRNNNKEYLEFGISYSASRIVIGSCGGKYFRVYNDGSLIYPKIVWKK